MYSERIYCDISATTPVLDKVADEMYRITKEVYGNPSSIHLEGKEGRQVVEQSRFKIARGIKCQPTEIIFTSSGSESNNMVLKGVLKSGDHFITTSYEHPAVIQVVPYLQSIGVEITIVIPNSNGVVEVEKVVEAIQENTKLVSVMFVNNELGTINNIEEISKKVKESNENILFHTDGVQALGKIPLDMTKTLKTVDFLSMTAHKLYGPKGVGALFIRDGNKQMESLIHGGGQEMGYRASTENIIGIGGFGLAVEDATKNLEANFNKITELEQIFQKELKDKNMIFVINGSNSKRIPGVFNITFQGMNGFNLVNRLNTLGVSISFGAACHSGKPRASALLLGLGLTEEEALSTVRISFGKIHTQDQIQRVVQHIYNISQEPKK